MSTPAGPMLTDDTPDPLPYKLFHVVWYFFNHVNDVFDLTDRLAHPRDHFGVFETPTRFDGGVVALNEQDAVNRSVSLFQKYIPQNTYVLHRAARVVPNGGDGISEHEATTFWAEYYSPLPD